MGRMLSVRVSEKTRRAVARRARVSGRSESEVVRQAIEAYVGREADEAPYAALRNLVGIVGDGPSDLSERSGDKVRSLLLARGSRRK
jgi:Arc/MetJ-type ribon-helix-helix transcriptional regulator